MIILKKNIQIIVVIVFVIIVVVGNVYGMIMVDVLDSFHLTLFLSHFKLYLFLFQG